MDSPPFFLGQRLGINIYATKVKINLIHWHTKLYIDILNKLFFQKKKKKSLQSLDCGATF